MSNLNVIDFDNMTRSVDRISYYRKDESTNFGNIIGIYHEMEPLYKTNNTSGLVNITSQVNLKFKTIERIHDNNTTVLARKIIDYRTASKKAEEILKKIKTD